MHDPTLEPESTPAPKPRKAKDEELKVINQLVNKIETLSGDSRRRVVSYLFRRYQASDSAQLGE